MACLFGEWQAFISKVMNFKSIYLSIYSGIYLLSL